MVPIYNGISPCHKKEGICVSPNEVDEPRAYYTEGSKSERKKQLLYTKAYIHGILKDGTNEPISRAAMETQILRTDPWTPVDREGGEGCRFRE